MSEHPLLDITIDVQPGGAQVRLRFDGPPYIVAANEVKADLALPAPQQWPDSAEQPENYGKALSEFLLSDQTLRDKFRDALNGTRPLRICLRLPTTGDTTADELHKLTWETLVGPDDAEPLLTRDDIYFARFLPGGEVAGAALPGRIRALVAIASPPKLAKGTLKIGHRQLWPVDVPGELQRARQSLGSLVARELYSAKDRPGEASLARLVTTLKEEGEPYQVLYLACHGAILKEKQPPGPYLWLDELDEGPVSAQRLVNALREMPEHRPRLVVLASCQSAGDSSDDKGMLSALGPKLVQEGGILAVVAMQGDVFMRTVEEFMPVFFRELAKDGQVERAMAMARSHVRTVPSEEAVRKQWPVPVLFSRLKTGQLWPDRRGIGDFWACRASMKPLIYVAHDTCGAPQDRELFNYLVSYLEAEGYEVLTDRCSLASGHPLESKLFADLARCDGAVVLLNEKAVAGVSWVLDEARVLRWRNRLETGFPLVYLCLDSTCQDTLRTIAKITYTFA